MSLKDFFSSIDSLHERQDMEIETAFKSDTRIASFEHIKRNSEGLGGGELIVDKTRQSIICLVAGTLGLQDHLAHRLRGDDYKKSILFFVRRIYEEAKGFTGSSHFTLVRNAASSDLIKAVKDGGNNTAIIIDGHGCKTWVNMTDQGGKRVTNEMLKKVVGDEKIGIIIKGTCDESDGEDIYELCIKGDMSIFGDDIAEKTLRAPFFNS